MFWADLLSKGGARWDMVGYLDTCVSPVAPDNYRLVSVSVRHFLSMPFLSMQQFKAKHTDGS